MTPAMEEALRAFDDAASDVVEAAIALVRRLDRRGIGPMTDLVVAVRAHAKAVRRMRRLGGSHG